MRFLPRSIFRHGPLRDVGHSRNLRAEKAILPWRGSLDSDGRAVDAHIGAIGVSDCPIRLGAAEAALNGSAIDEKTIAEVAAAARSEINPPSDIHAPAAYRRALVGTLLARGLTRSVR